VLKKRLERLLHELRDILAFFTVKVVAAAVGVDVFVDGNTGLVRFYSLKGVTSA